MTSLVNTPTGGSAITQNWTYDAANRVTTYSNSVDRTQTYDYDANGQLTNDTGAGNSSSYTYDANGNRTNSGYVTNAPNRVTSDGTNNYTYDAEGNMVSQTNIATGALREFMYDNRNRLVRVSDYYPPSDPNAGHFSQVVAYSYDAFDRLVNRSVTTYTPHDNSGDSGGDSGEGLHITPPAWDQWTSTDQYVYDGDHPVLDFANSGPEAMIAIYARPGARDTSKSQGQPYGRPGPRYLIHLQSDDDLQTLSDRIQSVVGSEGLS